MNLAAAKAERYYQRAKSIFSEDPTNAIIMERVLRDMTKAMSLSPNTIKHYMFLSRVYRTILDLTSSIACLRYILRLDSTNYTVKRKLADVIVLRGQEMICEASKLCNTYNMARRKILYHNAKIAFSEALQLGRNDGKVWVFKILCHIQLGEKADALEAINRIINPNKVVQPEVYILRAKLMWAHGLIEEGNKDIRYGSYLLPEHPEVLSFTARSYIKAERLYELSLQAFGASKYKDAYQYVAYAITITTEDVKLHILLAKIHRMMGDLQSAYASVQKATVLFQSSSNFDVELPHDIVRQTNLIFNEMALKYAAEEDYEKSIVLLNKVISSEKALARGLTDIDYRFYVNRADCYRMQHKLPLALVDYKTALDTQPNNWDIKTKISLAHYLNGMDYFNESNFIEADKELSQAIFFNPRVSEYFACRGKARYYCADFQGSYDDYRMVLALNPENDEIRVRLAQFEQELGFGEDPAVAFTLGSQNEREAKSRGGSSPSKPGVKLPGLGQSAVKVSPSDMVSMMLNPHGARNLPPILVAQSTRSMQELLKAQEIERITQAEHKVFRSIRSKGTSSKRETKMISEDSKPVGKGDSRTMKTKDKVKSLKRERSTKAPTEPPAARKVSPAPELTRAITSGEILNLSHSAELLIPIKELAIQEVGASHRKVKALFDAKIDTKRGDLWKTMGEAAKLVSLLRKDDPAHKKALPMPCTVAGLKRMSQELSRKSALGKNPLVAGVTASGKMLDVGKRVQMGTDGDVSFHDSGLVDYKATSHNKHQVVSDELLARLTKKGDNGDSDALKKNKRKQKKEPAFELKEKEQVEGIVEESGIAKLLQSLEEADKREWRVDELEQYSDSLLLRSQEEEIEALLHRQQMQDEQKAFELAIQKGHNAAQSLRIAEKIKDHEGVDSALVEREMARMSRKFKRRDGASADDDDDYDDYDDYESS